MLYYLLKNFAQNDYPLYVYLSKNNPELEFELHTHDYIELVYVVKGSGVNFVDTVAYPIIMGDVFVINMGSTHSFYTHSEIVIYNLMFKPELFSAEEIRQLEELPDFSTFFQFSQQKVLTKRKANLLLSPPYSEIMCQRLAAMETEIKSKKIGYQLVTKAQLIALIAELCRVQSANKSLISADNVDNNFDSFSKIIAFINSNYCRQISIKETAHAANLSQNYICEFFRKATGMTIVKYINSLRIEKARKLLMETDFNISEICFKCGFTDSSYFSKIFKQLIAQAPSSYRKDQTRNK